MGCRSVERHYGSERTGVMYTVFHTGSCMATVLEVWVRLRVSAAILSGGGGFGRGGGGQCDCQT